MQTTRALSTLFGFAALLIAAAASAQGQDASSYPSRPIKIIVAVPAGGGVDLSARIVADQLQKLWGQPVTVENRTGGGNNVAGEAVAKADPDGYTLLATPPNIVTVNAVLYKQLNYDPAALDPVAIMAVGPNVLAVKSTSPAKSSPTSSRWQRPMPENSATRRRATVRPRISPPSCSRAGPVSRSFTCRTAARRPPPTISPAGTSI